MIGVIIASREIAIRHAARGFRRDARLGLRATVTERTLPAQHVAIVAP